MAKLGTTITMTNSEYRPCVVKNRKTRKALFHMWSDKKTVLERFIVGIVEYEDGTCGECYVQEIQFIDNKHRGYDWSMEGEDEK